MSSTLNFEKCATVAVLRTKLPSMSNLRGIQRGSRTARGSADVRDIARRVRPRLPPRHISKLRANDTVELHKNHISKRMQRRYRHAEWEN